MKHQFKKGDIVRCVQPWLDCLEAGRYRVARTLEDYLLVEPLDGQSSISGGKWWPSRFELIEPATEPPIKSNAPAKPTAPQTKKVLDLLSKGDRLTRLTAMHYGIMNLTARISDLRNAGWIVKCDDKEDHNGHRYGSFYLDADQLPLLEAA